MVALGAILVLVTERLDFHAHEGSRDKAVGLMVQVRDENPCRKLRALKAPAQGKEMAVKNPIP